MEAMTSLMEQWNLALMMLIFPDDQAYSDLTYFDPLFGSADGVKTVALTDDNDFSSINGTYSVMLNKVSSAQISQDVDLSAASR